MERTTIIVENKWGRLWAFPADRFMALVLRLKGRKARAFTPDDVRYLKELAEQSGREFCVDMRLKPHDLKRWEAAILPPPKEPEEEK